MFAHTVGYSAQGGMGLEKQMQEYLMSADISLSERLSNDLKESKDLGNSVYTSLDPAVQLIAYNSLAKVKVFATISNSHNKKHNDSSFSKSFLFLL
jgi:peptidoglycan glycosyltransferase